MMTNSNMTSPRTKSSTTTSAEIDDDNSRGLRTSLDQGMAAVRRWISTRSSPSQRTEHENVLQYRDYPDDEMEVFGEDFVASPSSMSVDGNATYLWETQPPQQPPLHRQRQQAIPLEQTLSRSRSLSEPDAVRIRDFLFQQAVSAPQRRRNRRRRVTSVSSENTTSNNWWPRRRPSGGGIELPSSPASASAYLVSTPRSSTRTTMDGPTETESSNQEEDTIRQTGAESGQQEDRGDSDRAARERWTRINRRFQVVINVVALIFSLLLFAILICWVGLTCAYIASVEKTCDVPLKTYYWLVTLQLILDVFRTDIMRLFFRWDATSNQRIPCRVITYNFAYLTYALLVLRLGVNSILNEGSSTCKLTAPELFQASSAFVYLSSAAWSTILFGYLVPFCFVAIILTLNGYTPSSDSQSPNRFTVFPTAMGAPPGCVDRLQVLALDEFPAQYPVECCICMEDFTGNEVIVVTECNHVFHKQCCTSWLRQARTCPICRMDIPNALEQAQGQENRIRETQPRRIRIQEASRTHLHHEVVTLLQIVRSRERRLRNRRVETSTSSARNDESTTASRSNVANNVEEGRTR